MMIIINHKRPNKLYFPKGKLKTLLWHLGPQAEHLILPSNNHQVIMLWSLYRHIFKPGLRLVQGSIVLEQNISKCIQASLYQTLNAKIRLQPWTGKLYEGVFSWPGCNIIALFIGISQFSLIFHFPHFQTLSFDCHMISIINCMYESFINVFYNFAVRKSNPEFSGCQISPT